MKIILLIGLAFLSMNIFSQPSWDLKGKVCGGRNFDAEILGEKIYIISNEYYEIDTSGSVLFHDTEVKDIGQAIHDFHPAITVHNDSTVFVLRRTGGSKESGFVLKTDKRSGNGEWVYKAEPFGQVSSRNYVVDIVAVDSDTVLAAHTSKIHNVSSSILFYEVINGEANHLGTYAKNIRTDADFRMKKDDDNLYVATGHPGPWNHYVYLLKCELDSIAGIVDRLDQNTLRIIAGSPRKAFPDLAMSENHIGMSFGPYQSVFFSRIRKDSLLAAENKLLFTHTGEWHLNCGLSAVASSPDGKYYVAVGLRAKGNQTAANSDLIYTYSADSGKTWSNEIDMGVNTDGNEGRQRPVLLYSNDYFYLLYYNSGNNGINLAKLRLADIPETLEVSGTPTIIPEEGDYDEEVKVEITAFNPSSRIYYTLNGSRPSFTSKVYTGPFYLRDTTMVLAIEYEPHHLPGEVIDSALYNVAYVTSVNDRVNDIKIWPVPASDVLNISSSGQFNSLHIYDLQGRLLHSQAVAEYRTNIDLTGFRSGVYSLRLYTRSGKHENMLFIKE